MTFPNKKIKIQSQWCPSGFEEARAIFSSLSPISFRVDACSSFIEGCLPTALSAFTISSLVDARSWSHFWGGTVSRRRFPDSIT